MEKFIPYEKLSKKQKRQLDTQKRRTWGTQNPVTRTPQNSRAYNRKRAQRWKKDLPPLRPLFSFLPQKGAGKRLLLSFFQTVLAHSVTSRPGTAQMSW